MVSEVVAHGAAMQAAIFFSNEGSSLGRSKWPTRFALLRTFIFQLVQASMDVFIYRGFLKALRNSSNRHCSKHGRASPQAISVCSRETKDAVYVQNKGSKC